MTKLSIIVPVYNVEKYVRSCIESIFRQGLDDADFEVIIVNDGTPDRSMEVIEDIIRQHRNITVINQENQGLSVARNNGIEAAKGEYIFMSDSDDLLTENSLKPLLEKALETRADMIVADFMNLDDDEIAAYLKNPILLKDCAVEERTGDDMLLMPMSCGCTCVWHTLFNREFLKRNNLHFIPHIYFEDTPFTLQCYAKAGRCLKANWPIYIYRKGHESIINSTFDRKKLMDRCVIVAKLWELSQEEHVKYPVKQKLLKDTYTIFTGLIYLLSKPTIIPRHEAMEVIRFLKHIAPDLSFQNGIKQHLATFLYRHTPSLYLHLLSIRHKLA